MRAPVPLVTTCALVTTSPLPEMTKPEPRPPAELGRSPQEMTVTTPGDSRW